MENDERGSVSALVVGLLMSFVACAGLAVDGGRLISAKVRVSDKAENAARFGAQALTNLRLGIPAIDRPKAASLAKEFLGELGSSGHVETTRVDVCVTVRESVDMTLLALIGVDARQITTRRCAQPVME